MATHWDRHYPKNPPTHSAVSVLNTMQGSGGTKLPSIGTLDGYSGHLNPAFLRGAHVTNGLSSGKPHSHDRRHFHLERREALSASLDPTRSAEYHQRNWPGHERQANTQTTFQRTLLSSSNFVESATVNSGPTMQDPRAVGGVGGVECILHSSVSRQCSNCKVSQTRQWVRGDGQMWLCHSCGQFWRKNGYARPKALWNRPTFKRSSRKRRNVDRAVSTGKKVRSPRVSKESVSSSFLKGKKMVECEEQLHPISGSLRKTGAHASRSPLDSRFSLPQLRHSGHSQLDRREFRLPPMSLLMRQAARIDPYVQESRRSSRVRLSPL